jgi:hypothetical protein
MSDYFTEVAAYNAAPSGSLAIPTSFSEHSSSAPPVAPAVPPTSIVVGVGAQQFRITCTGLKAMTLHKAFLLTTDVTANCAPISNTNPYKFGANLVSDSSGYLQFDYNFVPTNSPYSTYTIASNTSQTVAIIPAGNQTFKVSSLDSTSTVSGYIISKGAVTS